jgi:L-asparaginase II
MTRTPEDRCSNEGNHKQIARILSEMYAEDRFGNERARAGNRLVRAFRFSLVFRMRLNRCEARFTQ